MGRSLNSLKRRQNLQNPRALDSGRFSLYIPQESPHKNRIWRVWGHATLHLGRTFGLYGLVKSSMYDKAGVCMPYADPAIGQVAECGPQPQMPWWGPSAMLHVGSSLN